MDTLTPARDLRPRQIFECTDHVRENSVDFPTARPAFGLKCAHQLLSEQNSQWLLAGRHTHIEIARDVGAFGVELNG